MVCPESHIANESVFYSNIAKLIIHKSSKGNPKLLNLLSLLDSEPPSISDLPDELSDSIFEVLMLPLTTHKPTVIKVKITASRPSRYAPAHYF